VLLLLALAVLLLGAYEWRKTAVPVRPLLPTKFEHIDHVATQCIDCHHNWVDEAGGGACYNCHKNDAQISYEMEPMFHEFCWGCHIEKRHDEEEEDAGPVRECALCHPDA
jgi:hypothetical protein